MGSSAGKPSRLGKPTGNGNIGGETVVRSARSQLPHKSSRVDTHIPVITEIKDKLDDDLKRRKSVWFKRETGDSGNGSQLNNYKQKYIKLKNHTTKTCITNTQYTRSTEIVLCTKERCMGAIVNNATRSTGVPKTKHDLVAEARDFIDDYYVSLDKSNSSDHIQRWQEIVKSIEFTGTYHLTYDELCHGAKMAWRNAPRCIGRIQWTKLQVFDCRNVKTCKEMFEAICRHIRYCTNKGNIRSGITVFPHRTVENRDFRIWNSQFIRYAGYQQSDGSVLGDPISIEFTEVCKKLGWKGKGTMFDLLPLVLQVSGDDPELFELPDDIVLEVPFRHPRYEWFEELGLKWYALPTVTNMIFDCGGLGFTAAPFSGWYMSTEIGARNLCDTYRYNVSEIVATKMGLDTKSPTTLWKDKAILEVNVAVLHSFQQDGVTITDHHSASESFMKFMTDEQRSRGGCPADWVWIVPPISGSATPVFHQEMIMYKLKPAYEYHQTDAWKTHTWISNRMKCQFEKSKHSIKTICWLAMTVAILMKALAAKRLNCTILYATVTGNAYRYAKILYRMFSNAFNVKIVCMDKYFLNQLVEDRFLLDVTSTFGNGDPPENGMELAKEIRNIINKKKRESVVPGLKWIDVLDEKTEKNENFNLKNMRYSVFGLGSRAYPNFCSFAHFMNTSLRLLGADPLRDIGEGDELSGQEASFATWAKEAFLEAAKTYHITDDECVQRAMKEIEHTDMSWAPNKFNVSLTNVVPEDVVTSLSKLHNKSLVPCKFKGKKQLHSYKSSRQTLLVELILNNSGVIFQPGDHVCIYPKNNTRDVQYIIDRLCGNTAVDSPVRVERHDRRCSIANSMAWKPVDNIPVCTIRSALTYFIDINSPPTQALLKEVSEFADDVVEGESILDLSRDSHAYQRWRNEKYPSLVDVLKEFPSVNIPPEFLLTQFPYLKERFYSISSSLDVHPGEVHLTVGMLKYKKIKEGDVYEGVCSSWFNKCSINDVIPCYVHSTPVFHMPADHTVPLIMIGTGTGIAPFRSFWQQRRFEISQKKEETFGDIYLFFGCREPTVDDIYFDELRKAETEGVITHIYHAYSREPGKEKVYVQDMMQKHSNLIFDSLFQKPGHVYVCGETQMAQDVSNTLCNIVQRSVITSANKAQRIVQKLRDAHRYHEELFGPSIGKKL